MLVFIQQIAGIDNYQTRMGFSIFFQISRLYIQPSELRAGVRSTTRLHVSHQIAAIDDRDFRAVRSAGTIRHNSHRAYYRGAQKQK